MINEKPGKFRNFRNWLWFQKERNDAVGSFANLMMDNILDKDKRAIILNESANDFRSLGIYDYVVAKLSLSPKMANIFLLGEYQARMEWKNAMMVSQYLDDNINEDEISVCSDSMDEFSNGVKGILQDIESDVRFSSATA